MSLTSRYASLAIDDEAHSEVLKKIEKENKKIENKNKQKDKPKVKSNNEAKELRDLAFGGKKKNKKNKTKEQSQEINNQVRQKSEESQSFEEWKERDKVMVEDNFTMDMKEAILQSQLEYEQKQSLETAQQQLVSTGVGPEEVLATLSKEERKKVNKQQKKAATMSLDQFNNSSSDKPLEDNHATGTSSESKDGAQLYRHPRHRDRAAPSANNGVTDSPQKEAKQGFFNQISEDVAKALNREQVLESYKNQSIATEAALIKTYQERLVMQEKQLISARQEIENLNTKVAEGKLKSKKLTEILLSGEMKEKTEVLVQVHKLEKMREELTSSLTLVSSQLEQEKTLVGNIETEIKRVAAGNNNGPELELCTRLLNIIKTSRK